MNKVSKHDFTDEAQVAATVKAQEQAAPCERERNCGDDVGRPLCNLPMSPRDARDTVNAAALSKNQKIMCYLFLTTMTSAESIAHFTLEDLTKTAKTLGTTPPKNLPDIVHSVQRYGPLPDVIARTAPQDLEWKIEAAGRGSYVIKLMQANSITPNLKLKPKQILDRTLAICDTFDLTDKGVLDVQIRQNSLIPDFVGEDVTLVCQPAKGAVKGLGQVDIDAIYMGMPQTGETLIVPILLAPYSRPVDGHKAARMLRYATKAYPDCQVRTLIAQKLENEDIALFEVTSKAGEIKVVREQRYDLGQP